MPEKSCEHVRGLDYFPPSPKSPHDFCGIIEHMAEEIVKFNATKTVQKPTVVRFRTKDGQFATFKAVETVKEKVPVRFRAKKRREYI